MEKTGYKDQFSKRTKIFGLTFILSVSLLVYSNSINNEILFGWDDGEYIENEDVQNFDLKKFFSTYYLGMYQPLAVTSIALNYKLSGMSTNAYHGFNLLFHLLNIILVFYIFSRLSKRFEMAFIVALLFAIHPMHTEAISWIAARSSSLYAFFYLSALLSYITYLNKKSYRYLVYAFLLFAASCFSKSMAVSLPLVLLLLDYFKGRKINPAALFEKVPFLLVSIAFGIVAINAASEYGHIKALNTDYNFSDRIVMLIYSVIFYIVKVFAPVNLSAVYAFPAKEAGFLPWPFYFGILVFIALVVNVIKSGKLKKDVVFGGLFFLVTIALVLPLVWSRMFMLAERYTYLPYLGIYYFIGKFYLRIADGKNKLLKSYKPYVTISFLVFVVFLGATTYQRNKIWKNTITLTSDVINKKRSDADVAFGHFFRGNVHDRMKDYQAALKDFDKAIDLNPEYTMAYNNRGITKGILQNFNGAYDDFNKASQLQPDYAQAIYNRGNANYYLGEKIKACKDWQKAAEMGSKQADVILKKYCE